jgi:lysophospholipase L1-like esterase
MRTALFIAAIIGLVLILARIYTSKSTVNHPDSVMVTNPKPITYIPIGDSYTIGRGVEAKDRWPNVLTERLNRQGIAVELVANPALTGYTVRDAINYELPEVERLKPDFVTVFIGANDCCSVRGIERFDQEYRELLDKLQAIMTNPKNIVLITIPNYTKAPAFRSSGNDKLFEDIEKAYNEVIIKNGTERNLPVADIYPLSLTMTGAGDYILDGIHPSAQGYRKWESVIFPVVLNVVKNP